MIDSLLEKNLLPDRLVRIGIRRLLAQRLRDESARYDRAAYVADLKKRPLAEQTAAANEQHYEVPTRFYELCLGQRLKYSGCLYPTGTESLDQAEEAMLALYAERAQLADGQRITSSAAAGARSHSTTPRNFRTRRSPRSPTRARKRSTSTPKRNAAASPTS